MTQQTAGIASLATQLDLFLLIELLHDVIKIKNNRLSKPFIIRRSFPIMKNITILGQNGRPIIAGQGSMQPTHLFQASKVLKQKLITLRIENIIFREMGILRLTNVVSDDDISFENCYFKNTVTSQGIISVENSVYKFSAGCIYFHQCHFTNNVALQSSRFIAIVRSDNGFHKCYFRHNLSTGKGLIFLAEGFSDFKNNFFERNTPISEYYAARAFKSYKTTMYKYITDIAGGVIWATTNSTVNILNCSFKANAATRSGGAICMRGRKLIIKRSLFEHNVVTGTFPAYSGGGAIFSDTNSVADISNCLFVRNKATYSGGAIYFKGKEIFLKSSLFEWNSVISKHIAKTYGGAVAIGSNPSTVVKILNGFFNGNKATAGGGAVLFQGRKLMIKSSIFDYNTAMNSFTSKGGALIAIHFSVTEILNCSFKGNEATYVGGAIFAKGRKFAIRSSSFEHNTVGKKYNGKTVAGAIFIYIYSVAEIVGSLFRENEATWVGGAVCIEGKKLIITSSVFEYNMVRYSKITFGGAICALNNYAVEIFNCSFRGNKATFGGGAIVTQGKKLVVKSSLFQNNTVGDNNTYHGYPKGFGDAICIKIVRQRTVKDGNSGSIMDSESIYNNVNCSFQRNMAWWNGGAIYSNGVKSTIKNSTFKNNSTGYSGGAISISSVSLISASISECYFNYNKAFGFGGAVQYCGKELIIITSSFQSNIVLSKQGEGGGLHTSTLLQNDSRQVLIDHCTFDGNYAPFRGGAIMTATINLFIRNSLFRSASYPYTESYSGGDLLYSKSSVVLERVSFLDADSYNFRNSLIYHEGYLMQKIGRIRLETFNFIFSMKAEVHMTCFTGKIIALSKAEISPGKSRFLSVSCSVCPLNFYSLYRSLMDLFSQNQSIKKTNTECYHCPLGGICERGIIRAADNFWGYKLANEVRFVSCPLGYCCLNKECLNYSSCHKSRSGILCGQCQKGFTENLLTPDCLLPEKCHQPLYLLVVIILGIVYLSVLMYINEITKTLKSLLLPGFIPSYFDYSLKTRYQISEIFKGMLEYLKSTFSNESCQGGQTEHLTNYVIVNETENEEQFDDMRDNTEPACNEQTQNITVLHKGNS